MALPGYTTLLDIAVANGSDVTTGLIDEATKLTPEVRMGASRTIKGTSYKTWVRTGLPGSPFRNANQGVAVTKSTYENRVVETFILNPQWEADKAVADRYEFGAAAYIGEEAKAILEGAVQKIGRCFFYGRNVYQVGGVGYDGTANTFFGGDTSAFPGLIDGFNTTYELDAQGTTANTASSVWFVKFGNSNVSWVWGEAGTLNTSDVMLARATDASNTTRSTTSSRSMKRESLTSWSPRNSSESFDRSRFAPSPKCTGRKECSGRWATSRPSNQCSGRPTSSLWSPSIRPTATAMEWTAQTDSSR